MHATRPALTQTTMTQIPNLILALKRELKAQGKTYADLARELGISEPAVKRTFSEQTFTLERFEKSCQFLGITLGELFARSEVRPQALTALSAEQEDELLSDPMLLLMANLVLNRWQYADICRFFTYTEHEAIRYLARLDRMRMIELLPGNAYRLLVSRYFKWRQDGKLQRFFEQVVQREFFRSSFDQPGDKLVFASGMLSKANFTRFHLAMERLAKEFDDLVREDAELPITDRYTCSLVLAHRPWTFPPFAKLRRAQSPERAPLG